MAGSAFKDPTNVANVKRAYTPVLIDGADPSNAELAMKYGVRGFPTVVFTDRAGAPVERIVGADAARFAATATRLAK